MAEIRIRFRTDGWHWADHRNFLTDDQLKKIYGEDNDSFDQIVATPRAGPGDTWAINWCSGGLAGYAICCPKCKRVHAWTSANNCSTLRERIVKDDNGKEYKTRTCDHVGKGSCWIWTGSAEENTLTAHPSLHCTNPDCGFHGWLQNGVLRDC